MCSPSLSWLTVLLIGALMAIYPSSVYIEGVLDGSALDLYWGLSYYSSLLIPGRQRFKG